MRFNQDRVQGSLKARFSHTSESQLSPLKQPMHNTLVSKLVQTHIRLSDLSWAESDQKDTNLQ